MILSSDLPHLSSSWNSLSMQVGSKTGEDGVGGASQIVFFLMFVLCCVCSDTYTHACMHAKTALTEQIMYFLTWHLRQETRLFDAVWPNKMKVFSTKQWYKRSNMKIAPIFHTRCVLRLADRGLIEETKSLVKEEVTKKGGGEDSLQKEGK